jgi:GH35 family endo-1,4-beta-xylanase
MDDLRRASADLAKSGIEFVITELDMALTFLDIADTSKIDETVKRNQENARKAYETVQRLLKDLRPNRDEKALIGAKISVLEARLQAGGYQL